MRLRTPFLLFTIAIVHAILDIPAQFRASPDEPFDHQVCIDAVKTFRDANTTAYRPELIYTRASDGTLNDADGRMVLQLEACKQICGHMKVNWYSDRGPRLMTWIIPILLLLSNIELSPLDKRRFYSLFQALADPIDMLSAYIYKLNMGTQIYRFAFDMLASTAGSEKGGGDEVDLTDPFNVRVVGTVLFAVHDSLGPDFTSFQQLADVITHLDPGVEAVFVHWRDAALQLADGRTDERLRSCFSILLYILQLLSAFVFDIGGGSSNPPGGVIAIALTLTFLIPMVLLSATTGSFTSRRSSLRILRQFFREARAAAKESGALSNVPLPKPLREKLQKRGLEQSGEQPKWDRLWGALHFDGGKDTYRPWKMRPIPAKEGDLGRRRHRVALYPFLVATFPILARMCGGLSIMTLAGEGGWSCRHVLLLSMLGAWLLSALLSSGLYALIKDADEPWRRCHWWFCLAKDVVIGGAILAWVSITAAGFYNSCSCWGREMFLGDGAGIVLDVNPRYVEYNTNKFPGIVSGIVGFQLLFSLAVILVNRKGVMLLRWSEASRQELWQTLGEVIYNRQEGTR